MKVTERPVHSDEKIENSYECLNCTKIFCESYAVAKEQFAPEEKHRCENPESKVLAAGKRNIRNIVFPVERAAYFDGRRIEESA